MRGNPGGRSPEPADPRQLDLILDTALVTDYPPLSTQTVFFPMPPSTNALWRLTKGGNRVPTKIYIDWQSYVGWVLHAQRDHWQRTHGLVVLQLLFERVSMLSDIDNRLKAAIDALVKAGVMDDDRRVVGLCVAWAEVGAVVDRAAQRMIPESAIEGLRACKDGAGMARLITVLPNSKNIFRFNSSADAKSGVWLSQEEPY